jgi:homoserine kinase type II
MAVYTKISDQKFRDILTLYNIGEFSSAREISEGIENTNYFLDTTQNKFITTIYERRTNPKDIPFFMDLLNHLAQNKIPCPRPIKDKNGNIIQNFEGKPLTIVSFVEGAAVNKITDDICFQVGQTLAKMHLAADGNYTKLNSRENSLSINWWEQTLNSIRGKIDDKLSNIEAEIFSALEFVKNNWPKNLPTGIIHADLFPDNVFFQDGKISAVIDFYMACNDILAYDLAIAVNSWCFEEDFSFNKSKAENMIAGYNSVRPLSAEEVSAMPILYLGASIRFIASRLYDYINPALDANVKTKNPMEYISKMRFYAEALKI